MIYNELHLKTLSVFKGLVNLLFPNQCMGCEKIIHEKQLLCISCLNNLPKTNFHTIKKNPVYKLFYGRCQVENGTSFAFFQKNNLIQKMLHALKYKGRTDVGTFFGNKFGEQLKESVFYNNIECVISVPIHRKRRIKRGYNQVENFAKATANKLSVEYIDNVLYKSINKTSQVKKRYINRWDEGNPVFKTKNIELIENKHVLLLDDVITSGNTLESCISVLEIIPRIKISVGTISLVSNRF